MTAAGTGTGRGGLRNTQHLYRPRNIHADRKVCHNLLLDKLGVGYQVVIRKQTRAEVNCSSDLGKESKGGE